MMDNKALVEQYRQLVLEYEAVDKEIDALLASAVDGLAKNLTDEQRTKYHDLFMQRAELKNQISNMEHDLKLDDDD